MLSQYYQFVAISILTEVTTSAGATENISRSLDGPGGEIGDPSYLSDSPEDHHLNLKHGSVLN